MPLAYIGLGSNLGDRIGQMSEALELLQSHKDVRILRVSPVYQNRAVGMGEEADDFLNAVVEVSCSLEPLELLEACLVVEQSLGRKRAKHGWTPRSIDLDLLVYEGVDLKDERLTLPHSRIAERDFVVVPLADLAPELEINGRSIRRMVDDLSKNELRLYDKQIFGFEP